MVVRKGMGSKLSTATKFAKVEMNGDKAYNCLNTKERQGLKKI